MKFSFCLKKQKWLETCSKAQENGYFSVTKKRLRHAHRDRD